MWQKQQRFSQNCASEYLIDLDFRGIRRQRDWNENGVWNIIGWSPIRISNQFLIKKQNSSETTEKFVRAVEYLRICVIESIFIFVA